ncbi:MAG: PEP-CTERM domain protein, partial [Burkholderiales bacterium RIFOXYC12_FULL_60_6]
GSTAHGFEIELEGLHSSDITDTFGGAGRGFPTGRGFGAGSVERYGSPSITEYTNGAIFGTRVTYFGIYDGTSWDFGTPTVPVGQFATPGDNCWSGGGLGYNANTPCDHFGVGTRKNATKTTYTWLHDNGAGELTGANGVVSLPAPVWNVVPAVVPVGAPPAPPVVQAVIEAPVPENEAQFGEAIWVKVFTTELEDEVALEQLIGGNPVIDGAVTEVEWQLLQFDPGNPDSGKLESGYGAPVGPNAASIIRRYEFYKYAGEYNAEDHEALVSSDSNPLDSEIGTYIGAQNAAANLAVVAVPEPETYAMLLVGVGLIGLRLRKRGRTLSLN